MRALDMTAQEKERCTLLMERLVKDKLYFCIFTMNYINKEADSHPEKGQNYDTNHIV
jgi:hypothetical protein